MIGIFSKRPAGLIGYYGLADWWLTTFTNEEREQIISLYQPLGGLGTSLVEGNISHSSGSAAGLITGLAGWFSKEPDRHIAYKLLAKAQELLDTAPVLDRHFFCQAKIQIYYRFRDLDDLALEKAVEGCKQQIAMSHEAAKAFKAEFGMKQLPRHVGFEQLAIIREKQKEFQDAISVCERAAQEGWGGGWDKRIERLKKKVAKNRA